MSSPVAPPPTRALVATLSYVAVLSSFAGSCSPDTRGPTAAKTPLELLRHPYVQLATTDSIVVVWRTRVGATSDGLVHLTFQLQNYNGGHLKQLYIGVSNRFWGRIKLPMPLWMFGSRDCYLNISPDVLAYRGTSNKVSFRVPRARSLAGITFYAQWIVFRPSTPLTTRAARVSLGPY